MLAGVQAPAALLASFVPMFLIAAAFYYMNRADLDCGTTFSWVTRTLGPVGRAGSAGWAICTTGILVIGSLADVGRALLLPPDRRGRRRRVEGGGHDPRARDHRRDDGDLRDRHRALGAPAERPDRGQVGALLLFAAVALVKVIFGRRAGGSVKPEASWFSPFAVDRLQRARRRRS